MFTQETFDFLDDLGRNNTRAWFDEHRQRYEDHVREPALAFIEAMGFLLPDFAPRFRADTRRQGGSLMRVHRDTRFARVKTPYKTNIGIQFRHEFGKDVHAPGFYVHIAPQECFLGVGIWHPEPDVLRRIREHISDAPERWFSVRDDQSFVAHWMLTGDRLTRLPRGIAADHPAADDLKWKDFIASAPRSPADVIAPDFVAHTARSFSSAIPYMRFLCEALTVPY